MISDRDRISTRQLNRLRRRATHARVRFFLVGEDTGCVEVEIEREA